MELDRAKFLAEQLIQENNLVGYKFQFDSARSRFGYCNCHYKVISLSEPLVLLNVEDQVKQTVLHEIAHALTLGHNHDEVWKATAIRLGDTGNRCYDSKEVKRPEPKHIYACCKCGYEFERIKRMKRYGTSFHQKCGPKEGRLKKIK